MPEDPHTRLAQSGLASVLSPHSFNLSLFLSNFLSTLLSSMRYGLDDMVISTSNCLIHIRIIGIIFDGSIPSHSQPQYHPHTPH